MNKDDFRFVSPSEKISNEQIRPGLTFWKDAWRRLKKNKLAIVGLVVIGFMTLVAIFGPMISPYTESQMMNGYENIPPRLTLTNADGTYFYFQKDLYDLYVTDSKGTIIQILDETRLDNINYKVYFDYNGEEVILNYAYIKVPALRDEGIDFSIIYQGVEYKGIDKTVGNQLFWFGTDDFGRDVLTRVMYGARISLTIALVATIVIMFIGILYGSIAGVKGGMVDNIMMRIIDIINSIPLILYVILIMVILDDNSMYTVILTLALVYWVNMARLVRGQILGLKNQEFVLAARALGVPQYKIVLKHLIPNALGPIVVSLTMMIPSAIFTEAFLSFIGLGASAPQASWGTLANDAVKVYRSAFYQLLFPALAIAITILAFNFFGDGLRSALDPKLRKG